ncbi:hypothetical protein V9T40_005640 [Parthenolecanium corni]|uniref:Uncharacterized protein n=1 Tax=Parthenolecanium corni TaxID=536013 RepID=A0AAN9U295_9HEMI
MRRKRPARATEREAASEDEKEREAVVERVHVKWRNGSKMRFEQKYRDELGVACNGGVKGYTQEQIVIVVANESHHSQL